MEYRNLGASGLKVSELCLGTMQFGWTADEATSKKVMSQAFEAGINFIDTADIYSHWVEGNPGGVAERFIGRWLTEAAIPRDQVVLATKARGPMGEGPNQQGLSRKHLMHAVDESLRRLQTDYIDLYQLHFPDDETQIEETLATLDDLVSVGKVRYLGCSNYKAWQLVEALWVSDQNRWQSFVSLQPHYNLVHRMEFEAELAEVCRKYGIGVIPYSPLAGGFLTDKYEQGKPVPEDSRGQSSTRIRAYMEDESNWRTHQALEKVARDRNASASQIALAWLLSNPVITSPIIGPKNLDQLEDNLGAAGLRLDPAEVDLLEKSGDPQ